jgi:hypothetical protein
MLVLINNTVSYYFTDLFFSFFLNLILTKIMTRIKIKIKHGNYSFKLDHISASLLVIVFSFACEPKLFSKVKEG